MMQQYNRMADKIREIAKLPHVPDLSDDLIAGLSDLCFYQSAISNPDLLFVFGSNILHKKIALEITKIVHDFSIQTVILTGGVANYTSSYFEPIPESELIFTNIQEEHFPNTRFIMENESKNSLENIKFSLPLFDFSQVQNIAYISHAYASMRSYLTLKKYAPNSKFGNFQLKIPSEIPGIPVDSNNWYKTDQGRKLVWGEYLRFRTYGSRGDFPIADLLAKLTIIEKHMHHNEQ